MTERFKGARAKDRWLGEVSTQSPDPTMQGIGSSPGLGDWTSSTVTVPPQPTLSTPTRYLIRLCGYTLQQGKKARVQSLRQYAEIGQDVVVAGSSPYVWTARKDVTSSNWSFIDGNLSWHLRFHPTPRGNSVPIDPLAPTLLGQSLDYWGTQPGLLYTLGHPGFAAGYVPPAGGVPPGYGLGPFGTFRDLRFPWGLEVTDLALPIVGPGTIALWVSVWQGDPTTRPAMAPVTAAQALTMRPEDQFVIQWPNALYTRVGGAILLDLSPGYPTNERRRIGPR
jgi:hypothetical protein